MFLKKKIRKYQYYFSVARDFDSESSGDDDEIMQRSGSVDPSDVPKTVATSADISKFKFPQNRKTCILKVSKDFFYFLRLLDIF